jgi:hypothetical protein
MDRNEHLGWLLNDLIYDLVAPSKVLRDYLTASTVKPGSDLFLAIARMTKSSAILALTKLHDVLRDYGAEIRFYPEDIQDQVRMFRKFADDRKLVRLRNKFIAHNFDDFKDSSYAEGEALMDALFGQTLAQHLEFFEWIHPEEPDTTFEKYHLSYLVTRMRDHAKTIVDMKPRVRPAI